MLVNLSKAATKKASGLSREASMIGFGCIFSKLPSTAFPLYLPYLPLLFNTCADKGSVVREAAEYALDQLTKLFPSEALGSAILPVLYAVIKGEDGGSVKWQTKIAAMRFLKKCVNRSKDQVARHLEVIVEYVTGCMHDTKPEVMIINI